MEKAVEKLDTKDNTLWKNLDKFEKNKLHVQKLEINDDIITNDEEITEALAKNFEQIYEGNIELGNKGPRRKS